MSGERKVYRTDAGQMVDVASHTSLIGGFFDWLFSSLAATAIVAFIFGALTFSAVLVALAILTHGLELFALDRVVLNGSSVAAGLGVALHRLLGGDLQLVIADLRSDEDQRLGERH